MVKQLIKVLVLIVFLLPNQTFSKTKIYPQFGLESYIGPNQLLSLRPWAGFRLSLSSNSSFILKYHWQSLSYEYPHWQGGAVEVDNKISYLTGVYYYQKPKFEYYGALTYINGTNSYNGVSLDVGTSIAILPPLKLQLGLFLLSENSRLWFPEDEERTINLYSLRIGVQIKLFKKFFFDPKIYISKNSEEVDAFSYALGFIFSPKYPFYITVHYSRYSESGIYKFSGDYILASINLYF